MCHYVYRKWVMNIDRAFLKLDNVQTGRQKVKGPVKPLPTEVLTHSDLAWVLGRALQHPYSGRGNKHIPVMWLSTTHRHMYTHRHMGRNNPGILLALELYRSRQSWFLLKEVFNVHGVEELSPTDFSPDSVMLKMLENTFWNHQILYSC